jgi:alanine racemase
MIKVSQHSVQKQVKPCKSVMTLQADIIRVKQALNSTGSTVGLAWVTVCWGVMACIRVGHADGGDCCPSDIRACQPAHHHIPNMRS